MTAPDSVAGSVVPLADIIARAPDDQEPAPGFVASLHGQSVEVTAVLERTAVVAPLGDRWADKQLVRLADLLVDPAAITWGAKASSTGFPMKRRRYSADQREAMRAASDRRAQADQARQAAAVAAAREAAPQPAGQTTRPETDAIASRPVPAAVSRRAITAAVARAARQSAASNTGQLNTALASELHRARQRIADLEAKLEHHRAVARDVQRRVELAVGRRAA